MPSGFFLDQFSGSCRVRQSCGEEIHRLPCVREGGYNTGEPPLHTGIAAQSL